MAVTHREVGDHVIEKGVPVPGPRQGWKYRGTSALLRELRKRESVVINAPRNHLSSCMSALKKATGREFTSSKQEDGTIRVWRIA